MQKMRNADFHDMKMKEYVRQSVPDIDISNIFVPKKKETKEDDLL